MNITNLEMAQATIEFFGGLVCLMLALVIFLNGHKRKSWKNLMLMFLATSGIFFAEACAYIFRGNTNPLGIVMTRISNFGVFLMNLVLLMLFMKYLYCLLQEKGVVPGQIFGRIVAGCVIVSMLILVGNLFAGWMYRFTEENYYQRNTGWYVYTALNVICIFTMIAMLVQYRKSLRKKMLAALMFYVLVPVIAIIVQAFVYGISVTNIGIFIALILMLLVYLKEWSGEEETEEEKRKSVDIVLLLAIMTISMSASIISCVVSIGRISDDNSESNTMLISNMVYSGIDNEFLKPIMVAETMSNDYFLREYMKECGEKSPEAVESDVATYLESIRTGFGYQMVFAVCDSTKTYFSYNGISKQMDLENDEHDIWYPLFLETGKTYDLDVDTDEANDWALSVFVNHEIADNEGNFLGVCGVGVEMESLQALLKKYENDYQVKIDLIDENGLIQVDSDTERIERDSIDCSYLENVNPEEFYYEEGTKYSRVTKYMKDLGWYLVVEDHNPDKIDVIGITTPSVLIFMVGLIMMAIVFFIMSIRERKAHRELAEKKKISITDDLTGILNRHAYEEDCRKIQEQNTISQYTMIMMDVNGLKAINDTYGHMAGDELIIGAAKCIQTTMGKFGKVYRIGGDEFVALITCTEEQRRDMLGTLEHITENWSGTYQSEMTISVGVVVCSEHGEMSMEEIRKLADRLMYEDKNAYYRRTGKDRRRV